jgi:ACT domain-containing protein
MKAFITVIGKDKVGIIANVSAALADNGINIEDISQTILQGNFTMVMAVSFPEKGKSFEEISKILTEKGKEINLEISMRHMDIFEAMHRI